MHGIGGHIANGTQLPQQEFITLGTCPIGHVGGRLRQVTLRGLQSSVPVEPQVPAFEIGCVGSHERYSLPSQPQNGCASEHGAG